jgi:hypothetical protein
MPVQLTLNIIRVTYFAGKALVGGIKSAAREIKKNPVGVTVAIVSLPVVIPMALAKRAVESRRAEKEALQRSAKRWRSVAHALGSIVGFPIRCFKIAPFMASLILTLLLGYLFWSCR